MAIKQIPVPDDVDILRSHKHDVFATLNCVNIGEIISFDPATQTASVQVVFKRKYNPTPQGVYQYQEIPVLMKCPVITLFGGTSFVSLPIQAGDNCVVLFNDREIDNWFVNGGIQITQSSRMHDINDGIALVGINSLQSSIASYLANGIRLSHSSGGSASKIDLVDGAINSLAALFLHTGAMKITGNLEVGGNALVDGNLDVKGSMSGNGGTLTSTDGISAPTLSAGNGATGSGTHVTVINGIVTAVS